MKGTKYLMAAGVVSVYVLFPAYRYYVLGSWIGYKIISERQKYRVVRKQIDRSGSAWGQ